MPRIKPGTRLRSAVCTTEVMVIQAPDAEIDVRCGGAPLVDLGAKPTAGMTPAPELSGGTQIGKRYVSAAGDIELLCTKPGAGTLALGDDALTLMGAKPLPSSD